MRPFQRVLVWMMVIAMVFTFSFSAGAIGFEAETAYEAVFVIYSGSSLGSGFAVGENCIVTNAHVIGDARRITVKTYGGAEYAASVVGMDEQLDIAVLVVQDATFPYLEIADTATMRTGDDIYAIGAPKGMVYTLTKGGISAKERMIGNQSYIQIDAAINEGNSGGPLLNDSGYVLGMNTLKMSDSEGIGLAIPINRVCDYLRALDVPLNSNGNVVGRLHAAAESLPSAAGPSNQKGNEKPMADLSLIVYAITGIAVLSLAGNVWLTALLRREKKRRVLWQKDPRERTDFDIDIWE